MDSNWKMETIQERAANWSLEGDNQLLNLMKSISKNLEQRCTNTNNNLNRLMLDLDKTKIRLGNATTKILDLNNAKFVEHTVLDVDSLSNDDKRSLTGNEKTFVPLPKAIQDAVANGLNMMDRCYEKVSLDLEDSDDDDNENAQKHVVCRPKNSYVNRPLPYLIGSKQWNEKWHIGLIESDEEMLSDEELEEFSQSSEDEDSISISPQTSNPPTASESDFTAPTPTVIPENYISHQSSEDAQKNSPLFGSDFHTNVEKIKVLPMQDPIQNDLRTEKVNKTRPSEQPKPSIFVQQKSEKTFVNLFDDEPPLLDEPIRNERKPVNLFLDSDDDDDLNSLSNPKPTSIFNNNVHNRRMLPDSIPRMDNAPTEDMSNNLFHDDVDNNNVFPVLIRKETKPPPKSTDFGSLFDDEPPDDFFDIIVKDKGRNVDSSHNFDNKKSEKSKLNTKTVNLFGSDDDDDDDDFSKIIGNSTESSVIPSVKEYGIRNSINEKKITNTIRKNVEDPKTMQDTPSQYSSPYRSNRNTGPPDTYVSFLDDIPPNLDGEKEEDISSFHSPTSITSSPTVDDLIDKSALDDDYIPSLSSSRSSSKIVYDDIAETAAISPIVKGTSAAENQPTVSLEIPTKSVDDQTQDETDQSSSFKKNLSMFANPDLGRLPPIDTEHKPKPNKLKTNFNINVAALLPGAKLPSQKHTHYVTASHDHLEEVATKHIENVEPIHRLEPAATGNIPSDSSSTAEDKSGLLTCLCKSRAKIQVQRRPSTRSGRQRLYTKSLVTENEIVVESVKLTDDAVDTSEQKSISEQREEDIPSANTPRTEVENEIVVESIKFTDDAVNTSEQKSISEQREEDIPSDNTPQTEVDSGDWLTDPTDDQIFSVESNLVDADEEDDDWLKNIDEKPPSPNRDKSNEDDWLSSTTNEPRSYNQNVSHMMNYDWLIANSLPPDDINPPSNNSIDNYHDQDDWLTASYVTKEKPLTVADLPNVEDDWLTSETKQHQQSKQEIFSVSTSKRGNDQMSTASVSKSETFPTSTPDTIANDDDDDWLTQSLLSKKLSTDDIIKTSGATVENQSSSKLSVVARRPDNVEPKPTMKQSFNSSLFDDDDDDDDDLFNSIIKKQSIAKPSHSNENEAVKSTKNVSIKTTGKGLFGDDEDSDDDDLFGSSRSTKMQTQNNQKVLGEKHKKNSTDKRLGAGLFDDDDGDDDDIFSSKVQKPRVNQTDKSKKNSVTKLVSTIPAPNDPLADLLK